MIQEIIGIVGVSFIAVSWVPQLVHTIRIKKSGLDLKFGLAQFIGAVLLIAYAYMVDQLLWSALNVFAAILIAVNLRYIFKEKRK